LFSQVLGLLSAEGLITLERVMHDGTKVKACAGVDTFRREEKLRAHLEAARERVEQMGDPQSEPMSPRMAKARERAARERKERLERALQEMAKLRGSAAEAKAEQAGTAETKPEPKPPENRSEKEEKKKAKPEPRVSETDPEARIMKQSDGGFAPSYNVQISTDAAHGVIVGVEVSQCGSDYQQLVPSVEKVEENMGQRPEQVVVDGGFTSRENILAMEEQKVDLIGSLGVGVSQSAGQLERRGVDPAFYPEAFRYDVNSDTYICPAGKVLSYARKEKRIGVILHQYRARAAECASCLLKQKCCPQAAAHGRMIVRPKRCRRWPPSGPRCKRRKPNKSIANAEPWQSSPMLGLKRNSACDNSDRGASRR